MVGTVIKRWTILASFFLLILHTGTGLDCYVCDDCDEVTSTTDTCSDSIISNPPTTTVAPGGNGTTLAPGGNGTTLAPGGNGTTLAPGGNGTTLAPGGNGTTLAPGGNGTTLAPGGNETTLAPGGNGTTLAPGGNETTLAPGGNGTTLAPGGNGTTNSSGFVRDYYNANEIDDSLANFIHYKTRLLKASDTHTCYKAQYDDNGVTKTKRGCLEVGDKSESQLCSSIGGVTCHFCTDDLCNPAARAVLNVFALVLPVVLACLV